MSYKLKIVTNITEGLEQNITHYKDISPESKDDDENETTVYNESAIEEASVIEDVSKTSPPIQEKISAREIIELSKNNRKQKKIKDIMSFIGATLFKKK